MRILLVEDEGRVASFVVKGLVGKGNEDTGMRDPKNAFTRLLGCPQSAGLRLSYE